MNPKYSILLCNQDLNSYEELVNNWLYNGIKVLWFGTASDEAALRKKHPKFISAYLLQVYTTTIAETGMVVDGHGDNSLLKRLSSDCKGFNFAQYSVEHCNAQENIIVQASAGTGKTTVMMDRIMYLMHTKADLKMSEIFMITFTNEAAQQMNNRLQDVLMTRYMLTHQKKYLLWVEEQSQMNISTIHSFAYSMLKKLGIGEGFTRGLAIRSFEYERQELIKDAVDESIDGSENITKQLGVPFYRANAMINEFWGKFAQLGVSHHDMADMDWGEPATENSTFFHNFLENSIPALDNRYLDLKREEDAVAINDIIRDLQSVLQDGQLPTTDLSMKYLFIDEFQDSDLSQIDVACLLGKLMGTFIFVVGDVKQSIYRFRGATEKAFETFRQSLQKHDLQPATEFLLVNNYRTASGVLKRMDTYFSRWGQQDYLTYKETSVAMNRNTGSIRMIPSVSKETDPEQISSIVNTELDRLIAGIETSGKAPSEKDRIAILTRSNRELNNVASILRHAKIPVVVQQEGAFYISEAVRDFYLMVTSFLFSDEPKHIFNYLITPYAGEIEPMDINAMERLSGDKENLVSYLDHFLSQTNWKKYHKMFRLKPVMSVFKEMLDAEHIVNSYISLNKARRKAEEWPENRIIADTTTSARQYQANLEKLMEILQNTFNGDKVSLYDIYHFLKLNIATNREESEVTAHSKDDYTSVLCMTVHKSKGLEFDTVIIPYTNENFGGWETTELLVDPTKKVVGWNYDGDQSKTKRRFKYLDMKNTHYAALKAADVHSGRLEGVRILYVGMTRAINNLICIVEQSRNPMSWARLIEEVGVDYE